MATGGSTVDSGLITFDIFEGDLLNQDDVFTGNLTQEEQEEIKTIVSEIASVNSHELIDFATQEVAQRHKQVTPHELDRLASKNNADSTVYQTKWAITVLKGNFNFIICSKVS